MPTQVQFRRGTQSQNNSFKGAAGEISVNIDTNAIRVHNGIATGGFELAKVDLSNVTGQAPYAVSAGVATYSGRSGIATYATSSGVSTYASTAGIATYSTSSGVSTYSSTSGIATYSTSSGISTYASTSGIATVAVGFATTSSINTTGIITAARFIGDGSGLTNVSAARTTVSGITTAIVANGIGNTNITGFRTYGIIRVGLSTAGWLRLYTDSISRSNDASRSIGVDPTPGSGVILEVVTTGLSTSQIITPFTVGSNVDEPSQPIIYASVTNLSGITTTISVNLTILRMEA